MLKFCRTLSRAARPIARARSSSRMSDRMASARASASPLGTSNPVRLSSIISQAVPVLNAMTGRW